jgi:hypothetical protein
VQKIWRAKGTKSQTTGYGIKIVVLLGLFFRTVILLGEKVMNALNMKNFSTYTAGGITRFQGGPWANGKKMGPCKALDRCGHLGRVDCDPCVANK